MNYKQALSYIKSLERRGIKLGLKNERRALKALGGPEESFLAIHVAGTNGKGSVSAMLESVLREFGFRTGLYTSPHLYDVRERTKVNGKKIGQKDFARVVGKVKRVEKKKRIPLTYFEFLAAAAFQHFADKGVEIAVVETGMGGRLDATNVVDSIVSVITKIGIEHTKHLGKSLEKIAKEKAGIIKPCQTVVTGEKRRKIQGVFAKVCGKKDSRLVKVWPGTKVRKKKVGTGGQVFDLKTGKREYRNLKLPLLGEHQRENAAIAVGVVEALAEYGIAVPERVVRNGLAKVEWPARFQIVKRRPAVVLDAGHNPDCMKALKRTVKEVFGRKKVLLVFGVADDKDAKAMAREICGIAKKVFVTRAEYMGMDAGKLEKAVGRYCEKTEVVENPNKALKKALKEAGKNDVVLIAGSVFLVGEIKKI